MSIYPRNIARCQHIKTNGTQCGSPALKGRRLCFFHNRWRETRVQFNKEGSLHFEDSFHLPVLEDPESIQVALMQVLRLILARHIDAKNAGLLLYGLQTAAINVKAMKFEPFVQEVVINPRAVAQNALGDKAWYPEQYLQAPPPPVKKVNTKGHHKPKSPSHPAAENPEPVAVSKKPAVAAAPAAPLASAPPSSQPEEPIFRAIPAPRNAPPIVKDFANLMQTIDKLEALDKSG